MNQLTLDLPLSPHLMYVAEENRIAICLNQYPLLMSNNLNLWDGESVEIESSLRICYQIFAQVANMSFSALANLVWKAEDMSCTPRHNFSWLYF